MTDTYGREVDHTSSEDRIYECPTCHREVLLGPPNSGGEYTIRCTTGGDCDDIMEVVRYVE